MCNKQKLNANRIAQFYKVSANEYNKARITAKNPQGEYDAVSLPRRATSGSAGYDFFAPFDLELKAGESAKIPTAVRAEMADGWVLMLFPRSSLGFKYRLQLDNTVGIIDSDYFYADNEGHIFIKITNDNREGKSLSIKAGEAFAQGVFVPFGITVDDDVTDVRKGGFGSTNKSGQVGEI